MTALETFMQVHERSIESKSVANMYVADAVMRKAIAKLSEYDPEEVVDIADMYDGRINYNNFLTEREAKAIVSKFKNYDGTEGAKWPSDAFFEKVEELCGSIEVKPYFNKWALWATACMIASDQGANITKWSGGDRNNFAAMTYDFAVAKLSDKDKQNFVRWYFELM